MGKGRAFSWIISIFVEELSDFNAVKHALGNKDCCCPVIIQCRAMNKLFFTALIMGSSLEYHPHSGDYDLPELFNWINGLMR